MNRRTVETLIKYDGYIDALYNSIDGSITKESMIEAIHHDMQEINRDISESEIYDIVDILTEWEVVK